MTICPCCNRPMPGDEPPLELELAVGGFAKRGVVRVLREHWPKRVPMYKLISAIYGQSRYNMNDPANCLIVLMYKIRKELPQATGWTISKSHQRGYTLERANAD